MGFFPTARSCVALVLLLGTPPCWFTLVCQALQDSDRPKTCLLNQRLCSHGVHLATRRVQIRQTPGSAAFGLNMGQHLPPEGHGCESVGSKEIKHTEHLQPCQAHGKGIHICLWDSSRARLHSGHPSLAATSPRNQFYLRSSLRRKLVLDRVSSSDAWRLDQNFSPLSHNPVSSGRALSPHRQGASSLHSPHVPLLPHLPLPPEWATPLGIWSGHRECG